MILKSTKSTALRSWTLVQTRSFLGFLYTGRVKDETNGTELFSLASLYEVPELKNIAECFILNKVDESNALAILDFANFNELKNLMDRAFYFVKRANPTIKLDEALISKPDAIKRLINARQKYEESLEKARKELEEAMLSEAWVNLQDRSMTEHKNKLDKNDVNCGKIKSKCAWDCLHASKCFFFLDFVFAINLQI